MRLKNEIHLDYVLKLAHKQTYLLAIKYKSEPNIPRQFDRYIGMLMNGLESFIINFFKSSLVHSSLWIQLDSIIFLLNL